MNHYSTDEINTGVPDLVARCAALESEVARLREELTQANERWHTNSRRRQQDHAATIAERDTARRLLRELAAAVLAHESEWVVDGMCGICGSDAIGYGGKHLQNCLLELARRVDAEAGETR